MASEIHESETRKKLVPLLLAVSAIAGIVLFIVFVAPRSESGSQFILGLSASRAAISLVFLVLLLVNIGATLFALLDLGTWQKNLEGNAVAFVSKHLMPVMLILYATLILAGAFLLLSIPPVIRPLAFLESLTRLGSFVAWIFL